jgi:hypothetical protein
MRNSLKELEGSSQLLNNAHLDKLILPNKNILCEKYKLISNLKAVFLQSVTLLLYAVLEVHVIRRDYFHLILISRKCVQSTLCLATRYTNCLSPVKISR